MGYDKILKNRHEYGERGWLKGSYFTEWLELAVESPLRDANRYYRALPLSGMYSWLFPRPPKAFNPLSRPSTLYLPVSGWVNAGDKGGGGRATLGVAPCPHSLSHSVVP